MASPLFASLALISSALPSAAPLEQLFQDHRIETPSLSLADKGKSTELPPLTFSPAPPAIAREDSASTRKTGPEMRGLMPSGKAALLDPKLVHAPADTGIDYKLIVKEVKIAPVK